MRTPSTLALPGTSVTLALLAMASPVAADPAMRAEVVLPPGNSTTFTLDGVVAGELTGDPGAFGTNVDDQRDPCWSFDFFDGAFRAACADPEVLDGRAKLCVDDRGVPRGEADTLPDAWYGVGVGVGVAAGRQRLFLMDAIRRTARGRLSELTGPTGVPEDVEARVLGYTHPGLHHVRDSRTDLRLPVPGTGEFDGGGFLPFEATPQVVDPEQGFLANWNNKPAAGWQDGQGQPFASLPAGRGQRVTTLLDELATRDDWSFEALGELDAVAASRDPRTTEVLDLLLGLGDRDDLSDLEREALALLAGWDRSATGPGAPQTHTLGETATHGPAFEPFDRFATRLPQVTSADLHDRAPALLAARNRVSANHPFGVPSVFNLAVRVLDPTASSLTPAFDHLDGRFSDEVLPATLRLALEELVDEQGTDDLAAWRGASCDGTGVHRVGDHRTVLGDAAARARDVDPPGRFRRCRRPRRRRPARRGTTGRRAGAPGRDEASRRTSTSAGDRRSRPAAGSAAARWRGRPATAPPLRGAPSWLGRDSNPHAPEGKGF